jgi:predicted O-methyltransferase YrrM
LLSSLKTVPEMKIATTEDVNELLGMYIASAALGAALELGLFWRLAEEPRTVDDVTRAFGVPFNRCQCWLELLTGLGLLERRGETYAASSTVRTAILKAYSRETWALLAQEARERYPAGNNLSLHISHPESVWTAQGLEPPDYAAQMTKSAERARRFTRMLYEIHRPLAEKLAQTLDMTGVKRLMDLGGGSGVVSLSLLKRHSNLAAVVVDIGNVCDAGREIAAPTTMAERISYHAANFLQDELPTGFDMALECDVGIYTEELFRKVRSCLNPRGRVVIVDWFAQPGREPSLQSRMYAFLWSLGAPRFAVTTAAEVGDLLVRVGFHDIAEKTMKDGTVIIRAHK